MRLFVRNMPFNVTVDDLKAWLGQWGQVENPIIIRDKETKQSRGYGFIDVDDQLGPVLIQQCDGVQWGGRTVHVCEALPREQVRVKAS